MMNATMVLEEILGQADRIARNLDPEVGPGRPERLSEAAAVFDGIRQGDLNLIVVDAVPAGYKPAKSPSLQLVPGSTQGARHCLDSLEGVQVHLPAEWNEDSTDGPCLVLARERVVTHPTHGHVTIPAQMTILCTYQLVWDKEQEKARRAAD